MFLHNENPGSILTTFYSALPSIKDLILLCATRPLYSVKENKWLTQEILGVDL
jgi:hypothetical protein